MENKNCELDCILAESGSCKIASHEMSSLCAIEHKPTEEELETMSGIFKIISDPTRLRIILALTEGEMCVYHLTQALDMGQSAVSHQLRILKDNKILKSRRDGKNIVYSLADEHILNIINMCRMHARC